MRFVFNVYSYFVLTTNFAFNLTFITKFIYMLSYFHSEFDLFTLRTWNTFIWAFFNMLCDFWWMVFFWFWTFIWTLLSSITLILKMMIYLIVVKCFLASKWLIWTSKLQCIQFFFVKLMNLARLLGKSLTTITFITVVIYLLRAKLTNYVLAV